MVCRPVSSVMFNDGKSHRITINRERELSFDRERSKLDRSFENLFLGSSIVIGLLVLLSVLDSSISEKKFPNAKEIAQGLILAAIASWFALISVITGFYQIKEMRRIGVESNRRSTYLISEKQRASARGVQPRRYRTLELLDPGIDKIRLASVWNLRRLFRSDSGRSRLKRSKLRIHRRDTKGLATVNRTCRRRTSGRLRRRSGRGRRRRAARRRRR